MAGRAANVLGFFLIIVKCTVPHGFRGGVAVHTIQLPLAACELGDGLVIVIQTIGWVVCTRLELHLDQVIIAPVVAGVALGIRDGGG